MYFDGCVPEFRSTFLPLFLAWKWKQRGFFSTFICAKPHAITAQDHNFNSRNYLPIFNRIINRPQYTAVFYGIL